MKQNLVNLSVFRILSDNRRKDAHFFNKVIEKDYPELVFDTIINRKAATGRLLLQGFEQNKGLNDALSQYYDLYQEMINRMEREETNKEAQRYGKFI